MNQKFSTKLPPCSEWNLWLGEEIEGHSELGTITLFVRKIPPGITLKFFEDITGQNINRIWFCKEFADWEMLTAIAPMFPSRCLEVTLDTLPTIPVAVRHWVRFYLKIPVELWRDDHVCVGPAFADESFKIGTGNKVIPLDYERDKFIL